MRYSYRNLPKESDERVSAARARIHAYQGELVSLLSHKTYDAREAAVITPFDESQIAAAVAVRQKLGAVQHVVLVGIGGSSAGALAVYDAIRTEVTPELHVVDVLDSSRLAHLLAELTRMELEDFVLLIISKSGTTTETLVNADVLINGLHRRFGGALYRRVVTIGDPETPLMKYAEGRGMERTVVPPGVGGRYSVFTTVALVPLALLGFDIQEFVVGAQKGIWEGTKAGGGSEEGALTLIATAAGGRIIHALFSEHERLHGFVAWYEQLLAESLGKRSADDTAMFGVLPVSMSPRELHSTAQLYLSGFPNVFTTFIRAELPPTPYVVSHDECGGLVKLTGSRAFNRIPSAIMDGVQHAYLNASMPHALLDVGELSLSAIGEVMAIKMLEVMYVARAWDINAFDQPHVELYKQETRRLLQ